MNNNYSPRQILRPRNLKGISEDQIAQHWTLYEGYVKNVNLLNDKIKILSANGYYGVEFAELKRREGFEYNGMILHEHYFGILATGRSELRAGSELADALGKSFGGFESWKKQFVEMGHMRGTGWVILYYDPRRARLANFWIKSHEDGHPAGFAPIVVMDVWEHAFMVDWGADGRPAYVEAFFENIDWGAVDHAFREAAVRHVERRIAVSTQRPKESERRKIK